MRILRSIKFQNCHSTKIHCEQLFSFLFLFLFDNYCIDFDWAFSFSYWELTKTVWKTPFNKLIHFYKSKFEIKTYKYLCSLALSVIWWLISPVPVHLGNLAWPSHPISRLVMNHVMFVHIFTHVVIDHVFF